MLFLIQPLIRILFATCSGSNVEVILFVVVVVGLQSERINSYWKLSFVCDQINLNLQVINLND